MTESPLPPRPQVSTAALASTAQQLATAALESVGRRSLEADLRSDLFLVLGPFAVNALRIPLDDVKQEGTGTSGRFDSRFGRCVIEYKRPRLLDSAAERQSAAEQAIGYLEDPRIGAQVVVVTDGLTWGLLRDEAAGPELGEQGWFDLNEFVSLAPIDRFSWRTVSPQTAERVLTLMATHRAAPVSATSVASRLGPRRQEARDLIGALSAALRNREVNSRVDILFRQWLQLAGVAYGISDPDQPWPKSPDRILGEDLASPLANSAYPEAIFTLHTYVAFAAKSVAAEMLALIGNAQEARPSQWVSLSSSDLHKQLQLLEDGEITDGLRAPGLLAGDLFGWYAPLLEHNPALSTRVRALLYAFSELAWARLANARGIAGDLLREFYTAVVPSPMRKALGEFFTPQWIAERLLQRALQLSDRDERVVRILDPACGSGTFLVSALRRLVSVELDATNGDIGRSVEAAVERVIGFDINPVSTLMARVNLLLSLGNLIEHVTTVGFHIYQTDSILLPDVVRGQGTFENPAGDFRRLPLEVGPIDLPSSLATLQGLHALRSNIEIGLRNNRSPLDFEARLRVDLRRIGIDHEELPEALRGARAIFDLIARLRNDKKNGIWARVIEQAFAPSMLGTVDIVVGNPPWINWKHVPEGWQQRSEPTWRSWGLWQGRRRSAVPLADISALLMARSIATYAPDGLIALLMPNSFLTADPGNRPIRRCSLGPQPDPYFRDMSIQRAIPFRPVEVDDFTNLHPFSPDAANMPVAIYIRANEAVSFPIPRTTWKRLQARSRIEKAIPWSVASRQLTGENDSLAPVDPGDLSSPWGASMTNAIRLRAHDDGPGHYRWGQGFHTRGADGLFFCRVITHQPAGRDHLVRIRSLPLLGPNTRHDPVREAEIEAEFLWPAVRGRDVQPFVVEGNDYVIAPYDTLLSDRPLSKDELMSRAPHLYDYLEPWIDRFMARSAYQLRIDNDHPWPILGPWAYLKRQNHLVFVRYMHPQKRPPAAVRSPTFERRLGLVTTAYPNNKVNFIATTSEEEAHYLAAWVNAPACQNAIAGFVSSTTIPPVALERLPIPVFDRDDSDCLAISQLGRRCAEMIGRGAEYEACLGDVNELVLRTRERTSS